MLKKADEGEEEHLLKEGPSSAICLDSSLTERIADEANLQPACIEQKIDSRFRQRGRKNKNNKLI